jgi:hypothetical protein
MPSSIHISFAIIAHDAGPLAPIWYWLWQSPMAMVCQRQLCVQGFCRLLHRRDTGIIRGEFFEAVPPKFVACPQGFRAIISNQNKLLQTGQLNMYLRNGNQDRQRGGYRYTCHSHRSDESFHPLDKSHNATMVGEIRHRTTDVPYKW